MGHAISDTIMQCSESSARETDRFQPTDHLFLPPSRLASKSGAIGRRSSLAQEVRLAGAWAVDTTSCAHAQ